MVVSILDRMTAELNPQEIHRLKREIRYRARRSIKEMDDLIQPFIDARVETLSPMLLLQLRDMLHEMDQNLLASWRGEVAVPAVYEDIFGQIKDFHTL
jgi:succinate dehydrogenase flavin-adding protein (antitoxin of CptAB toxin-antitoxin module)